MRLVVGVVDGGDTIGIDGPVFCRRSFGRRRGTVPGHQARLGLLLLDRAPGGEDGIVRVVVVVAFPVGARVRRGRHHAAAAGATTVLSEHTGIVGSQT